MNNQRRSLLAGLLLTGLAPKSAAKLPAVRPRPAGQIAAPTASGRLSGGARGWPFGAPVQDLAARGYVLEEYFVEGIARAYLDSTAPSARFSGILETEKGESAPYRTRIYVVRPSDPAQFNGTVLVNWQNVTAGMDIGFPGGEEVFRGYAWIGVTAQKVGVDGIPGFTEGLATWDQDRYGSLHHPGDRFSYEIFGQAVHAAQADPLILGGLRPSAWIATGSSQSAVRLASYINIAHHHHQLFDGFLLLAHFGICVPAEDMPLMETMEPVENGRFVGTSRIHDRGDVPILVVNSETEFPYYYPARQAETSTFRFWEVAGAAHTGGDQSDVRAILSRDGLALPPPAPDRNLVDWGCVIEASFRRIRQWVETRIAPPRISPITSSVGTDGLVAIQRDRFGNALGGVRLPDLETPYGRHIGLNGKLTTERRQRSLSFNGSSRLFSLDEMKALYGNRKTFVTRWSQSVEKLSKVGALLDEDKTALDAKAHRFWPQA